MSVKESAIVAWIYVLAAGLLEIIWAVGLKYTDGFTRLWPSVVTVVTFSGSLFLLALAVQTIPIGTAYAMFVGIGAVGAAVLGIILFGEPTDAPRLFFLSLLIVSLIGLRLTSEPA
jgi:quaternary ammonium compound-resistance protein SugE